jgi:ribose/xylose/arabinose/galactoside ABC-type transport system permease subunit
VFLLFAIIVPDGRFLDPRNIENILVQSTVVSMAAVGATVVIVAGGLDLSVAACIALSCVVVARLLAWAPHDGESVGAGWAFFAALGGITAGLSVGVLNGALVNLLRIVPFVVTLGTMQIVRGLAKGLAGNASVNAPDSVLESLLDPVRGSRAWWLLLPAGVWCMLAVAALGTVFMRRTVSGRHLVALGSNERTARLCGVPIGRTRLIAYAIAGACAGAAGVLQYGYIGLGDPTTAQGYELGIIAAVVIGGGSLRGGEGTIFGSIVGALIIAVLAAGGVQMGWPRWVQEVMAGAIIVAAVAADARRRNV